MSSKDFYSAAIVPSGAMTGSTTIYSQVFDIRYQTGCSFAPVWTGTPSGTFTVQVSNDYVPNLQNASAPVTPGTWNTIQTMVPTQPAGSASNTFIPVYAIVANYIRLVYIGSSGTGTLSGAFTAKTWG